MEIVIWVLAGLAVGYAIGRWRRNDDGYNQDAPVRIVEGGHQIYLYSLDRERMRAIAERVRAGRPIRYRILVGKGRLLRRSEWDKFTRECVQRGILDRGKNNCYTPSPTGEKFFAALADPAHARKPQTMEFDTLSRGVSDKRE